MMRYVMSMVSVVFLTVTAHAASFVDPEDSGRHPKEDHALIKGFHKIALPGVRTVAFKPGESASFDGTELRNMVKHRAQHQFEVRSYLCDGDPLPERARIAADRAQKIRQFLIESGVNNDRILVENPQPSDRCRVTVTAFEVPPKL